MSVIVTSPLTVSARSEPCTPVTLTDPDTECTSTETDAGTRHRVVNRYVVALTVPIRPVLFVLGPDVDAAGAVVDGDLHARQLALVAARPLDRLDRHLVARLRR